jgi:hypothetical protein
MDNLFGWILAIGLLLIFYKVTVLGLFLIFSILKTIVALSLVAVNLILILLFWLYETITRKPTPKSLVRLTDSMNTFLEKMNEWSAKNTVDFH